MFISARWLVSLWLLPVLSKAYERNSEEKLFSTLMDQNHYDKRARPCYDANRPIPVTFRYDFNQLYDVSEKAQTVSVLGTVYQEWYDYRLYWNESEYGTSSVVMDGVSIWTPDTTLYNGVEMYRPGVEDAAKAVVTPNATLRSSLVNYFYNSHHTIGCRFDMRYFPFDTQTCTFQFGSWSQDGSMLNYSTKTNAVTTEYHQPSDVWSLVSFDMRRVEEKYSCCPQPFVLINARLMIRRRSLYYAFNLILPTVVINLLSSYALFASEGSPENRHDKLQIGLTTLLSYCILLLSVSDQIPKGSTSVPLLGIFYIVVMLQNALELIASIYLSFPDRRKKLSTMYNRIMRRKKPNGKIIDVRSKGGKLEETLDNLTKAWDFDGSDHPEMLCLWLGVVSTAIITSVIFAVGFSV